MSRGYRVSWRPPVRDATRDIDAEDRLHLRVELMPILDDAEMSALLREQLEARGWRPSGDDLVCERDGAEVRLSGGEVVATLRETAQVVGQGRSDHEASEAAKERAEVSAPRLREQVTRRLTAIERGLRGDLDAVVQRVYVEALKRKAGRMGEVEAIDERTGTDGELELTIRVKV